MINIYTIVCTDEYSEEEVVCSFTTEIRAREMTLALQELNHFNLSFYERQTSEFSKPWEELHSHQIEYPLKPPVTDEFRAVEAICSYGGGNDKTKAQFKKLLKERKETLAAYNKSFDKVFLNEL